ncbi:MAG TPA: hypothetical protein VGV18_10660, partial [Verrucomicrobiae bacterium]|nr:hypothetical protein [Verrucomicrobiae bacterium]
YPDGIFKNPQLTKPYTYQNGGDWCWFGGRMIQQLVAYNYPAEAYRALLPMAERVVRVGDFHEWWSRDNQPKGSGKFRGSAGVLGKAIEMLLAWAKQQSRAREQTGSARRAPRQDGHDDHSLTFAVRLSSPTHKTSNT